MSVARAIGLIVRQTGRIAGALTLALSAAAPAPGFARSQSLEYPVKANYLVKFTAFVEWPARTFSSASSPLVICVVGGDPFGVVLDRAAQTGSGAMRQVIVRRIDRLEARSGCHVAYIGASSAQTQAQAIAAVRGQPVLTVTDAARRGPRGMIHFAIAGNRVRFHIDDRAAKSSGLSISSRLLSLALSVRPGA